MGPLGFSVDQLMELAGLSVACSVAAEAPKTGKVLVLAGAPSLRHPINPPGMLAAQSPSHRTITQCMPACVLRATSQKPNSPLKDSHSTAT